MADKRKKYFTDHRRTAKGRGIDFDFTFEEWIDWWMKQLGPDWLTLRGCKKGQYVMARWYDDGAYTPHNVKCILAEDNHTEYNNRRQYSIGRTHKRLTDEVVRSIYSDERSYSRISKEYGVRNHQIYRIKRKKNYKKILDEL